jgi:DNA mismatch endonuclease (patch repair protein)
LSFDPLTPAQRSERMSRVRGRDTKPELVIRRLVWSLGYRYRMPRTRLDFWLPKLEGNKRRDAINQASLREMGWDYLVIWECQIKAKEEVAQRIVNFLEGKGEVS